MGNAGAKAAASTSSAVRRRLPQALNNIDEQALLQRIEAQEKERAKELPRAEELDAKSQPLDQLLSRIYGGITSQRVNVTPPGVQQVPGQHVGGPSARTGVLRPEDHAQHDAGHSPQGVTMSAKDRSAPIPEYRPSAARLAQLEQEAQAERQAQGRAGAGGATHIAAASAGGPAPSSTSHAGAEAAGSGPSLSSPGVSTSASRLPGVPVAGLAGLAAKAHPAGVSISQGEPSDAGPPAAADQAHAKGADGGAAAVTAQKVRSLPAIADDEPGRVQAYVLRDILEAKNSATAEGTDIDLEGAAAAHGADAAKLAMLLKYCAIPRIGRFKTFGHEYAFARPPEWWHAPSAGIYKSEAAMLELHEQQKQKAGQGGGQSTEGFVPPQLRRGQSKQSQQ